MISVWNKVDVCADPEMVQTVADKRDNTVCVSAQTGQGLPELMDVVERKVQESMMPVDVLVPYAQVMPQPNRPDTCIPVMNHELLICCLEHDPVQQVNVLHCLASTRQMCS